MKLIHLLLCTVTVVLFASCNIPLLPEGTLPDIETDADTDTDTDSDIGSIFDTEIDTEKEAEILANCGDPNNSIVITVAEFVAAEPNTTQWYELRCKIARLPQLESGRIIVYDDTYQEIAEIDGWAKGVFINFTTDKLRAFNDYSFCDHFCTGDTGDEMYVTIKTLRRSAVGLEQRWAIPDGSPCGGSVNGSPCAIYIAGHKETLALLSTTDPIK